MKRFALLATGVAATLTLTGCGFGGIYDVPLPGGADLGEHPYTVKAQFQDVLDLVPKSGVKVNEVAVGRVESIGLTPDGWHAEVTMQINGDVKLPANALANIRQSSLLGEKYVELSSPGEDLAQGTLADNAEIPLARTNRSVDVEEVLGALSMLLNGGGVEQLNTITKELNSATEGREPDIRNLLDNANQLVTTLDKQSGDITRALDGLNRLSATLVTQKDRLAGAIDNLGPGLAVLEQQRTQLVTMLQALQNLSGVTVDTINKSQEDLVADLRALLPTLQKLGEAGADLPKSLELLLTYPFTDSAVQGAKGDYFNLYAKIDLNLQNVLQNLGRSRDNPLSGILPQNLAGGSPSSGNAPLPLPLDLGTSSGTTGTSGTTGNTGSSQQSQGGLAGLFGLLSGGGA
ncbi:MCE family protein [Amycolatopsis sacchari]|uniref:Phospholipid/cholesterol/gamma-HCH transport system substrate-binding protein n=1 Tax=Amycolatopsis sacchari TaxID=115433 RepID=A0A1I3P048_9PSEU|nr:MCE family protein [Amycolatopsis sacchari]SFJ14924.1 phospholipid/cholesterol/gamma-HCH transport system substrate-binding protein [Amycolatopsis sacchari]